MSWRIRERILAFESRVDHHTLEVMPPTKTPAAFQQDTLHRPRPPACRSAALEFVVQTEIDMESGVAKR